MNESKVLSQFQTSMVVKSHLRLVLFLAALCRRDKPLGDNLFLRIQNISVLFLDSKTTRLF